MIDTQVGRARLVIGFVGSFLHRSVCFSPGSNRIEDMTCVYYLLLVYLWEFSWRVTESARGSSGVSRVV